MILINTINKDYNSLTSFALLLYYRKSLSSFTNKLKAFDFKILMSFIIKVKKLIFLEKLVLFCKT